jgi:hypothetical protein
MFLKANISTPSPGRYTSNQMRPAYVMHSVMIDSPTTACTQQENAVHRAGARLVNMLPLPGLKLFVHGFILGLDGVLFKNLRFCGKLRPFLWADCVAF